ncbi:MAG: hypothetical protein JNK84_23065 [Phreatobacter sp.]|uniref:hypothetical protein n=1 Tax=Phreatobacter sp. TaxID=1966341 RepID=UPI001A639BA5|nr:hypothetical protein [Phreatobacter sp.]MBL8571966.1 hypothetical protein [Phreatobacter sp.]
MMNRSSGVVAAMVLLLGVSVAEATPSFTLDRTQSRVLRLANLYPDRECHPSSITGRVVARRFEAGGTSPTTVILEDRAGRRTALNVHVETRDLGRYQIDWIVEGLQTLLREGSRVKVGIKLCGASGRVIMVDAVELAR